MPLPQPVRQLGWAQAGHPFDPAVACQGRNGDTLLQHPADLQASGGAFEGAEHACGAHQGGEAAVQGRGFGAGQLEPEQIDGTGGFHQLQSGLLAQQGGAAIAADHQVGLELAPAAQLHARHATIPPEQVDHGLAPFQCEGGRSGRLLKQGLKQGRLTHQGAGPHGIPAERFPGGEQMAAVDHEAPALERPLGQGGQQVAEPHGGQGLQARGHQGFAAKLALQADAGFHQGDGHTSARQEQGEAGTGWAGAHHHNPGGRGQRLTQTKEL